MLRTSEFILNFVLNAVWQIAVITAVAALGSLLLKNSPARFRHTLWVFALVACFVVPAIHCDWFATGVAAELSISRKATGGFECSSHCYDDEHGRSSRIRIRPRIAAASGDQHHAEHGAVSYVCYRYLHCWTRHSTRTVLATKGKAARLCNSVQSQS